MTDKCSYCNKHIWDRDPSPEPHVCSECVQQIKKLDKDTVNWLMMVIDSRIEKELDSHTDRYSHESSHPGYY